MTHSVFPSGLAWPNPEVESRGVNFGLSETRSGTVTINHVRKDKIKQKATFDNPAMLECLQQGVRRVSATKSAASHCHSDVSCWITCFPLIEPTSTAIGPAFRV